MTLIDSDLLNSKRPAFVHASSSTSPFNFLSLFRALPLSISFFLFPRLLSSLSLSLQLSSSLHRHAPSTRLLLDHHEPAQHPKLRRVQCLWQQIREHQLGPDVARDDDAAPSEATEELVADVHLLRLNQRLFASYLPYIRVVVDVQLHEKR